MCCADGSNYSGVRGGDLQAAGDLDACCRECTPQHRTLPYLHDSTPLSTMLLYETKMIDDHGKCDFKPIRDRYSAKKEE